METERAPGSLALITRGPEGSAVRSNIGAMVQEAVGPPGQGVPEVVAPRTRAAAMLPPDRSVPGTRVGSVRGRASRRGVLVVVLRVGRVLACGW